MDRTFDELFDDFFKKNNIKPEDKLSDEAKLRGEKLLEILTKFNNNEIDNENAEKEMDMILGKPDKIEFYNEGESFFEKRTWYTEGGEFVKLVITEDTSLTIPPIPAKSLQQEMEEAIQNEEYEKAAILRDKIHVKMGIKKKVRSPRKKTK